MGYSLRSGVSLALGLVLLALLPAAAAAQFGAEHSLRAPLTGERFYFVMTDRFENGSADNDLGGATTRPRCRSSRATTRTG